MTRGPSHCTSTLRALKFVISRQFGSKQPSTQYAAIASPGVTSSAFSGLRANHAFARLAWASVESALEDCSWLEDPS
jgi:hypothetical protein